MLPKDHLPVPCFNCESVFGKGKGRCCQKTIYQYHVLTANPYLVKERGDVAKRPFTSTMF